MTTIEVPLPHQSYQIAIAPHTLDQLGSYMNQLGVGKKAMIISNPIIFKHYGDQVITSLENFGYQVYIQILPSGERYKTLNSIQKIYNSALDNRIERSSTLIALGGGVIGDMTGFAAATWLRGVNFIQVPTTLLAMVDASIGGKTGVNHPKGKNLIGAFYQPRFVLIDPVVLNTLPSREFISGMAEVIKYGVIWDEQLFTLLESQPQLKSLPPEVLEEIICRSCQAKADVVIKDEKEANLRAILNYGHTIGHAIESLTQYRLVNHGEAVAIGMSVIGEIACQLDLWTRPDQERQINLIKKAELPTDIPKKISSEDIIATLSTDKKVKDSRIRFIVPSKIGSVNINDQIELSILQNILANLIS